MMNILIQLLLFLLVSPVIAAATLPTVTITYPTDGSAFNAENSLTAISGSTTDLSGVGMAKVELQITDGALFLIGESGTTQGFVPDNASWVLTKTSDEWKKWYFVTSSTIWKSGKTYTITVRATDKAGISVSSTSQFTYTNNIIISGTILEADGKPLQNVTVTFSDANNTYQKYNDTSGKYSWEILTGWSGTITPKKPGYTFSPPSLAVTNLKTNQLNSNFTATVLESEQDARAIIVAGGDLEDYLWTATKNLANSAYTVLRQRGIAKQNIRYLSMDILQDLDKEQGSDIYGLASSAALQDAITNWAGGYVNPKKPLIIYMVGHALKDQYLATKPKQADADIITSAKLAEWLNALQTKTGAKVIVIIESCYSGSFVQKLIPPAGMQRITIASAGTNELAYFASNGDLSFSNYFWKSIMQGKNLGEGFSVSAQQTQNTTRYQNPIMDANSDGAYTSNDLGVAACTSLGSQIMTNLKNNSLSSSGIECVNSSTTSVPASSSIPVSSSAPTTTTSTSVKTTTTSIPTTTTSSIPKTTTSIPTTTTSSIPTTTTSIPTTTTSSISTTTTSIPTTTTSSIPTTTTSISVKHPPTISGTPTTKATPGVAYNFIPIANDADGDALSFSIKNTPPWAHFNMTTGALTGTPAAKDYGIYGNIIISVTAGTDTVTLPSFEIFVEDISKKNITVTINEPTNGSAINSMNIFDGITGSTSDPGNIGIAKMEVQIFDGTKYMDSYNGKQGFLYSTPTWIPLTLENTKNAWTSWNYITIGVPWKSGKEYTITVRATDKAGYTVSSTSQFTYTDNIVISGTIVDGNGKPVPNIPVIFSDGNDTYPRSTDIAGNYTWEVPTDGWSGTITPKKPRYTFAPPSHTANKLKTNQLDSNFIATLVDSEQDARVIIVAGGDVEDDLWTATNHVTNFAYNTLLLKGIKKENIRYLNMDVKQDLDKDNINDIYAPSSSEELKNAIVNWAGPYVNKNKPLIIYMADHGDSDGGNFYAKKPIHGNADIVTAEKMQSWLNTLPDTKIILIIDTCFSGKFMQGLRPSKGKQLITISSTDINQLAVLAYDGSDVQSFSSYFWKYVLQGKSLSDSFDEGAKLLKAAISNQDPIITAYDGENSDTDNLLVSKTYFGNPQDTAAVFPEINESIPNSYIEDGKTGLTLWVKVSQHHTTISRVWGVVVPPGTGSEGQDPIAKLPIIVLDYNAKLERYETLFNDAAINSTLSGHYIISFYAQAKDGEHWVSFPRSISIQAGKDTFENDNAPEDAQIIVLNNTTPQRHNSHISGDADWVKFYALEKVMYQIQASKLGKNSDVVLELYDTDGKTLLTSTNKNASGSDENLLYTAQKDGVLFVKATQFGNNRYGADTEYNLKVFRPKAGPPIPFQVLINSLDKKPIPNALIRTNGEETAIADSQGRFTLISEKNTVDLIVNGVQGIQVTFSGKTISLNMSSNHVTSPAPILDVDKNGAVDATDGVLLLRKLNEASTIDTGVVLPSGQTNATVLNTINLIGSKLDVDQSGSADATDGVLILRKLNGASTIDTGVVLPAGQNNGTVNTTIDAIRK